MCELVPSPASFKWAAPFLIGLSFMIGGCSAFVKAVTPVLSEAGIVLADASNAVSIAEAMLPILHLSESENSAVTADIAKARTELSAAALAETATKDLTEGQLDASLADFRKTWALIASTLKPSTLKPAFAKTTNIELPIPLAVRRVGEASPTSVVK
jgi:hypothetical protein